MSLPVSSSPRPGPAARETGVVPPGVAVTGASVAARYWAATVVSLLLLYASAAPSVFYPLWGAKWDLSPLTQTSVYSCYPVALIVVLLFGGGISDIFGRRLVMLGGMALIGSGFVLMAVAIDPAWLFAGRILQGFGTGFALGAANAAIVDNAGPGNASRAATTITVSSATGLILGSIVTGALVQFAPAPLHLALFVLLALIFGSIVMLVAMRDAGVVPGTVSSPRARWRPRTISVPRGIWGVFGVSALATTAAYATGALALALGAQMARDLVQTSNALVIGVLLGITPVGIVSVGLAVRRPRLAETMLTGGILSSVGIGCLVVTAATGQLWLFVVALALGGLGQGLLTLGGLGLATVHAPPDQRGQTLSAVFLVAYFGQALTAIVVGLLATRLDLHRALDLFAPVMIAACLASSALGLREVLGRRSGHLT